MSYDVAYSVCTCFSLEQARMDHVDTMLRECCIMQGMQNAVNVNGILAACLTNPSQPLLVYPYADQGNLKKFLHKCKMSELAASHVSIILWKSTMLLINCYLKHTLNLTGSIIGHSLLVFC